MYTTCWSFLLVDVRLAELSAAPAEWRAVTPPRLQQMAKSPPSRRLTAVRLSP